MVASDDKPVVSRFATEVLSAQLQPFCEKHLVTQDGILPEATSNRGMRPAAAAEREPVQNPMALRRVALPEPTRKAMIEQPCNRTMAAANSVQ